MSDVVLFSYHLVTEWHKRQNHQLEMLQTERNTNDCDAEDNAHRQVTNRYLDAAADNPNHVKQQRQTTHWLITLRNLATEWPQGEQTEAHNLQSEWNSDNCEAEHESTEKVSQRDK